MKTVHHLLMPALPIALLAFSPAILRGADDPVPWKELGENGSLAWSRVLREHVFPIRDVGQYQRIQAVRKVDAALAGNVLSLTAYAFAPSAGFTNAELVSFIYLAAPADGILDLEVIAKAPQGPAASVMTPIVAHLEISPIPKWFKGFRVAGREPIERLRSDLEKVNP